MYLGIYFREGKVAFDLVAFGLGRVFQPLEGAGGYICKNYECGYYLIYCRVGSVFFVVCRARTLGYLTYYKRYHQIITNLNEFEKLNSNSET